ncbi:TRAP transporter small permease [Roseibium aggregatum]|uniref:TRAP transporter small permease protein n=1 Tax=Roseibium aggregatum TaxID=187304 RepID=A0A926NZM8_9HYPH|nr:TRAP transporter small permease [Roseibium aggregatum]MBD1548384.1 TRAP transporter small permease [Roseibium aggregatum]
MAYFQFLTKALAWVAAALFVMAGFMLTYEVVARYFFSAPTIWAAELSQLALIWGSLLAMAWLLGARRHIAVDALVDLLSPEQRRFTEAFAMLCIAAFSALVTWKGWDIFFDSFERGRTTGSMLDLPTWVTELAVPAGFALLFLQALLEAWRSLTGERDADAPHGGFE